MFVLEPEKLKIELILIDVVNLKVEFSQTWFSFTQSGILHFCWNFREFSLRIKKTE